MTAFKNLISCQFLMELTSQNRVGIAFAFAARARL